MDLTQVEGTGFKGRIIVDDVKKAIEAAEENIAIGREGTGQDLKVSETAKPKAEEQIPKVDTATAPVPTKSADDLAAAIQDCREAARVGYRIAKVNLAEFTKSIDKASRSLSRGLKSLESSSIGTPAIVDTLKQQQFDMIQKLDQLNRHAEQRIKQRRTTLDKFSVTLFGRTMTGKSTLREILTHGDGRSIGTGAQRKTRDVRSYYWNGLEVTDVPGVAAVDGGEDEDLALEAADQADLVLFLISDDAPQTEEAKCFAQVRSLGKPVLGICNVKIALEGEGDLVLFRRDLDKKFDQDRLDDLVRQFHIFADQRIPGNRVSFIFTHLRSRFLADRPEFSQHRYEMIRASRFDEVESYITREVVNRGTFMRVKSFIDASMEPKLAGIEALLTFSADLSTDDNTFISKQRQFARWQQTFERDGQQRISSHVTREMEELRQQVPSFSEDHYEDELFNLHIML